MSSSCRCQTRVTGIFKDEKQEELRNFRFDQSSEDTAGVAAQEDGRAPSLKDIDRVMYMAAWRRLSAVTQVITPPDLYPTFHNRLTHSQKVAQVARSIADNIIEKVTQPGTEEMLQAILELGGYDANVCEAAGLLHDIGHPPFGHNGEQVLCKFADETLNIDGFEGNAQTMRIVTQGNPIGLHHNGADLTMATLAALAKYPWTRYQPGQTDENQSNARLTEDEAKHHHEKYSFYHSEEGILSACRKFAQVGDGNQTLEAATMDVADDITYALHDLQDFLSAGLLDPSLVISSLNPIKGGDEKTAGLTFLEETRNKLKKYDRYDSSAFDAAVETLTVQSAPSNSDGTVTSCLCEVLKGLPGNKPSPQLRMHSLATFFSHQVGHYIRAVEFDPVGKTIRLNEQAWHEIEILKQLTRSHIIQRSSSLGLHQRGERKILEKLCDELWNWMKEEGEHDRLPQQLRWYLESINAEGDMLSVVSGDAKLEQDWRRKRALLDYISSLSDKQCISLYMKLIGGDVHELLGSGLQY